MANKNINTGNSDLTAGLIVLLVGVVFLLKAIGFIFPFWLISWPMLLIAIGLIILARNNFQNKNGLGVFLIIFGSFFLVSKYFALPFDIRPFLIPVGLILFGLYLILKKSRDNQKFNEDFFMSYQKRKEVTQDEAIGAEGPQHQNVSGFDHAEVLNAQALFTGIQRRIFSKNFKGGKISAIFGGIEIDFSQADFDGEASINLETAFGGVKLVVPPHWDVQVQIGTVFAAGVEDKRIYNPAAVDKSKVLKIYGSVVFGGLEIKSF